MTWPALVGLSVEMSVFGRNVRPVLVEETWMCIWDLKKTTQSYLQTTAISNANNGNQNQDTAVESQSFNQPSWSSAWFLWVYSVRTTHTAPKILLKVWSMQRISHMKDMVVQCEMFLWMFTDSSSNILLHALPWHCSRQQVQIHSGSTGPSLTLGTPTRTKFRNHNVSWSHKNFKCH